MTNDIYEDPIVSGPEDLDTYIATRHTARGNSGASTSRSSSQERLPNQTSSSSPIPGSDDTIWDWYSGYGYDFTGMDSDWISRFQANPYYRTYYSLKYQRGQYQSEFSSIFNNAAYEQKILEAQTKALEWAAVMYNNWQSWSLQLPSTQVAQYRDAGLNPAFQDITAGNVPEEGSVDFPEGLFDSDDAETGLQYLNAAISTICAAFSSGVSLAGTLASNSLARAQKTVSDNEATLKRLSTFEKIDDIAKKLADDFTSVYESDDQAYVFDWDRYKQFNDIIDEEFQPYFREAVERNVLSQRQHAETFNKAKQVSDNSVAATESYYRERTNPYRFREDFDNFDYFTSLWELQVTNHKAQKIQERLNNYRLGLIYQNDIDYYDRFNDLSPDMSPGSMEASIDFYMKKQQKELQEVIYKGRQQVFSILRKIYDKAAAGNPVFQGLATSIGIVSFLNPSVDYRPGSSSVQTDSKGNQTKTESSGGFGISLF